MSTATSSSAAPSASGNSSTPARVGANGLNVQTQTPIFECTPASYNYTGGTPPYLLYIINSGANNATVLKTLPAAAGPGTASWGVDIAAGTSITFVVQDSRNNQQFSSPIVVQAGSTSCVAGSGSSDHTGAIVGGVVGGVVGIALLALAAFFLIIRPARKAKSRGMGHYEEADTPDELKVSTPHMSTASAPQQPVGTYNLQNVDFNESSLDALRETQAVGLPSYTETGSSRINRPVDERQPMH